MIHEKSLNRVEVLLSTYNGEVFLSKFLDSLSSQSHKEFTLTVRDDGSSDRTLVILESYLSKFRSMRIVVGENIGWQNSFSELIRISTGDVIFFADQDDLWRSDKIEVVINKFIRNDSLPTIVAHRASIISSKGDILKQSVFLGDLNILKGHYLGIRGGINGCCLAISGPELRQLREDVPELFKRGHDFAVTLYGLMVGKINFVEMPLISWRKHDKNTSIVKINYFNIIKEGLSLSRTYGVYCVRHKLSGFYLAQALYFIYYLRGIIYNKIYRSF